MRAVAAALALAAVLLPRWVDAAGAPPAASLKPEELTPESACASIRKAVDGLARAERDQAFALSLAANGGSSALVETRLSALLDRSTKLRSALRLGRESRIARDPRVEQCMTMGFRALGEAESLTTTVEEMLYEPNVSRARPGLTSGARPAAPAVQP